MKKREKGEKEGKKERIHTQIILVVPLKANLQVMVLGDHAKELI
jgi:hypothetical protein